MRIGGLIWILPAGSRTWTNQCFTKSRLIDQNPVSLMPAAITRIKVSASGHDLPVFLPDGQQAAKRGGHNEVNLAIGRATAFCARPMHNLLDRKAVAQTLAQPR